MSRYIVDSKRDLLAYEQLIWTPLRCLEDADKAIDDAYQRGVEDGNKSGYEKGLNAVGTYRKGHAIGYEEGYEDGKKSIEKGCDGCKYEWYGDTEDPCWHCRRCYKDKYEPTLHSDRIDVGDKVIVPSNSHIKPGEVLSIVNGVCYIMWEDKTVSGYEISGVRRCTE